jgi:DNA-binding LacI/PurR family transcriptional regulator
MNGRASTLPAEPARRPTIRDVARLAGVSIGTVSSVLNDSDSVAPATRRHVETCMTELGYEPNNAARTLKRGRISAIGFIAPDISNPYFAMVAEGIQAAIDDADILLVLCGTRAAVEREEYFARVLRHQRLDGVIYLSGSGLPSPSLIELARKGRVVFVDEQLPGMDVPHVVAANRAGARAVANAVIEAGHRRIAIIGGPRRLWTAEQRLAGYREALAAAGLDPDAVPVVVGDYGERSGYNAASELLAGRRRPTALLCANDLMAIGALRRARELKLSVPRDLSLTGFDDIPAAALLDPPLTTVVQPGHEMGRAAAELLLHRIGARADAPPARKAFPTTLRLRGSVTAPR